LSPETIKYSGDRFVKITSYTTHSDGMPIDTVRKKPKTKKAIVADKYIKLLPGI
jgi:hypothetical protein